jgi:cyclophilin family peptidyl-prolyl cis-trans isomerase
LDGLQPDGLPKDCALSGESCHAVFGKVIEGMELVDAITPPDPMQGRPADVIESISVIID